MNKTKLISPAKINFDLKIKYYDENYEKHKISSKVVLLKIKDLHEMIKEILNKMNK